MRATIDALHTKTELFFRDQPKAKKEKLAGEVRALKIDLLSKQLELNRDKFKAHMISTGTIVELNKKQLVQATEQKMQLAAYEETLGKLRALTKQKDKPLDYFDWQLDFPEVLNLNVAKDAGFDIVIGNPPYVRHEVIKDMKDDLERAYPATFSSTADLFVYFIQLGHEILRRDGVFAYIVSNKWMRAGYGNNLRSYLGKQQLLQILDFGEQPVFEATAYTCVLISERRLPEANHEVRTWSFNDLPLQNLSGYVQAHAYRQPQLKFVEADYRIGNTTDVALMSKLKAAGVPLGEMLRGEMYVGLKTGYNKAFIIDEDTRRRLIAADSRSAEVIKPFVMGRETAAIC
jgi:adenine-specific DNA-methyltransferase